LSIYEYDPVFTGFYKLDDAPVNIEKIKSSFFKLKENPLLLRILFLKAAFTDPKNDHDVNERDQDGRPSEPKHSIHEYLLTKSDYENQEFLNWVDQNLKYLCISGINEILLKSIYCYAMTTGSLAEKDSGIAFLKSRFEYLLMNDLDSVLALINTSWLQVFVRNPADKDFMRKIIDHHLEKSSIPEEVKEKLILFYLKVCI
jgi:hypothetical protein